MFFLQIKRTNNVCLLIWIALQRRYVVNIIIVDTSISASNTTENCYNCKALYQPTAAKLVDEPLCEKMDKTPDSAPQLNFSAMDD